MDEFERRALEAADKRKGLKIDPLPLDELMALEFVEGARWARAEMQAEIERLTGIINHNLAEARFGDGRHMHLYDECERLKEVSEPLDKQYLRKISLLNETIDSLLAENEKLREALKFYAALSNVPLQEIVEAFTTNGTCQPCLLEYTSHARAALDEGRT